MRRANAMELHEFQAKELLSRYALGCPPGQIATTPEEAERVAASLGAPDLFVKAQIHAGSRFKAGGVRKVRSAAEAKAAAKDLLGQTLVTEQTGPRGRTVSRVLVEAGVRGARELYLAMIVDGSSGSLMVMGGEGGTDVEERSAQGQPPLETLLLGTRGEVLSGDVADFCRRLGLTGVAAGNCADVVGKIHRAFIELDASMIELNPLIVTTSGELIALDAKVILDDNAMFRHPDLEALREPADADDVELKAQRHQVNFVQLNGDIGVVVNGAGLGLATLDLVRAAGGVPANFMDIRTTAKSLDIAQGIGLVLDNPRAKVLLINVYGGGMQPCDTIIEGLGIAIKRKGKSLPIVLRLTGNNEDLARLRLANFNLNAIECGDMWQAATRAVSIAAGRA
ncbi:MAG: ADP-forming succinate--CoA ligase subunit beta [Pseudorhodoplanes sp.]|nr:ADP-forming succinate--CoA ligase subunit beta [Pseudorhodoplanes sp.]